MIAAKEGPLSLFKGALPRALWVSPLGAMNFAGYAKHLCSLSGRHSSLELMTGARFISRFHGHI